MMRPCPVVRVIWALSSPEIKAGAAAFPEQQGAPSTNLDVREMTSRRRPNALELNFDFCLIKNLRPLLQLDPDLPGARHNEIDF